MIKYTGDYRFERATEGSAGFDLHSTAEMRIKPANITSVGTGVRVAIPEGHVGLLFIRSSLGARGITLANSVGVIDSDYRGEIKVLLANISNSWKKVQEGERIAQLVVVPFVADAQRMETLDDTERGEGGFGSTG